MNTISLVKPTADYEKDIWNFRQEIIDANDESKFAGCGNLERCESAQEWIDTVNMLSSTEHCPEDRVPSNTYLAVREEDNKIVGIIDLRHHIDHPILGTWGGHIGYSVRPGERGKGYAGEMLRQNLINCRNLNIEKVLVTCDETNTTSQKIILSNGGVYENSIEVDGNIVNRYWIALS